MMKAPKAVRTSLASGARNSLDQVGGDVISSSQMGMVAVKYAVLRGQWCVVPAIVSESTEGDDPVRPIL